MVPYILLFVLGLAILLYPTVSDWWNQRVANTLVNDYQSVVSEMNQEDLDEIYKRAEEYNKHLIGNVVPDIFIDYTDIPNKEYDSFLDPTGTGLMGTIEIPVIKVNLPIYHYASEDVLEKGVGHLAGSSLPVGGESTHSVLSAHRGLPSAKLFTDLDLLKEGDVFYLHILNKTLAYQVVMTKVIEPTNTKDLSVVVGEDLCTLFTCTPYGVNTHRLLVRGSRIPYSQEQYQEANGQTAKPSMSMVVVRILSVIAGLLLALIIILAFRLYKSYKTPVKPLFPKKEKHEEVEQEE